MTELPPCLTVGIVHFGSNSTPSVLQAITLPSEPKKLNFHQGGKSEAPGLELFAVLRSSIEGLLENFLAISTLQEASVSAQ